VGRSDPTTMPSNPSHAPGSATAVQRERAAELVRPMKAAGYRLQSDGEMLAAMLRDEGVDARAVGPGADRGAVGIGGEIIVPEHDLERAQQLILEVRGEQAGPEVVKHCPRCRYPLAGLGAPDRCPECGAALDAVRRAMLLDCHDDGADRSGPGAGDARATGLALCVLGLVILGATVAVAIQIAQNRALDICGTLGVLGAGVLGYLMLSAGIRTLHERR
jgi:hypothetical protein